MMKIVTLACGHEPSPHSEISTGTAHLPDGREVCFTCADAWQRDQMRVTDRVSAYLASDGRTITTWSGGKLGDVINRVTRRTGFHGSKRDYVRVIDCNGRHWHGTGPGVGMYINLRASKGSV